MFLGEGDLTACNDGNFLIKRDILVQALRCAPVAQLDRAQVS